MKEHRDDPAKATREHHGFHYANEEERIRRQRKEDATRTLAGLREVEWAAVDDWGAACPSCREYRDINGKSDIGQHVPACELAALIDYWEKV